MLNAQNVIISHELTSVIQLTWSIAMAPDERGEVADEANDQSKAKQGGGSSLLTFGFDEIKTG